MALDKRFQLPPELAHMQAQRSREKKSAPNIWPRALRFGGVVFCAAAGLMLVPGMGTLETRERSPELSLFTKLTNLATGREAESDEAARYRLPTTHSEAEALLFDAINALRRGSLGRAEQAVDRLLVKYPNYQLAHLMRADILRARAGGIKKIGDGVTGSPTAMKSLDGLVHELEARVRKFEEPAIDGRRPDVFVQLAPQIKYALAVDVSRARLYVLENGAMGPKRVLDVYATIGSSGPGKAKEGDKRTPIGVYTLQAAMDRTKLTDFYGDGAFPLDYPNVLDKRAGRDGYGIWIHGVAKDNFVRPPRSSDGCIVVSNADLKLLTPYIQANVTPIAIADMIRWVPTTQVTENEMGLRKSIESWRKDWVTRDHNRYLDHYAGNFFSDNIDSLAKWSEKRRSFTEQARNLDVKIDNLTIAQIPNATDIALVSFDQHYKSDQHDTKMQKRQYWQRDGERWKIIYEGNT